MLPFRVCYHIIPILAMSVTEIKKVVQKVLISNRTLVLIAKIWYTENVKKRRENKHMDYKERY